MRKAAVQVSAAGRTGVNGRTYVELEAGLVPSTPEFVELGTELVEDIARCPPPSDEGENGGGVNRDVLEDDAIEDNDVNDDLIKR